MTERLLGASGARFALATPHVDATAAGAAAFDAGGNAVDAALAAATTLAVVYPHMCGVGGDLFALVREPEGRVVVVNASGAAPAAVDVDTLRRLHDEMPQHGPSSVTVPGAVSGWWHLATRWSTFGFARAIHLAAERARAGVPVARSLASSLIAHGGRIATDEGAAAVFLPAGSPLGAGGLLRQPALGRTLEAIAAEGPQALYGGEVGEVIADHLMALGSAMTIDDLAAHEAELGEPLTARTRDLEVFVAPPNSQGFVLLQVLELVRRLELDPDPLGRDAGTLAEIFRVTAADRDRANADPRFAGVAAGELLDEGHLASMAGSIGSAVAEVAGRAPSGDTVAIVAADASGLGVAVNQSLYEGFGSGILEPTTGVLLHNRGACFTLDPRHPNVIAGAKRPAHTLMPVVAERDGALAALAATMGGGAHAQINAATLLRALDLGASAEEAVSAPRFLVGGMDLGRTDREAVLESDAPGAGRASLARAGYSIRTTDALDPGVGHAQLILRRNGAFDAGSDPRADGAVAVR